MSSQTAAAEASKTAPAADIPSELLPADGTVEVDDTSDNTDGESVYSDTTSISSSIRRGIVENGRRYQTLREGSYWGPADDQAFESMNISHLVYLVLDSQEENPYFRSPVGPNVANILDVGTGDAQWAIDVADAFPGAQVKAIDLYPPQQDLLPQNLTLEVDDCFKSWIRDSKPYDLIHARFLVGSGTEADWKFFYQQAYENLAPGGWLELVEPSLRMFSDDKSLPLDSKSATWGEMFYEIGRQKTSRPMDICYTIKDSVIAAGFTNVHEKVYKLPLGPWPRHPLYKEAGRLYLEEITVGLEGYAMQLLTNFGLPEPWSPEEVRAHLGGMLEEWANKKYHMYSLSRRIWCQKPYDA